MRQTKGIVTEVFMPNEYREELLLDTLDNNVIGFKVNTSDGERVIIEEIDEFNSQIMKDDLVLITEQTIDGHYFIDIELTEDENEI
jgi:hypothetical protein